jgi:hypothetical protein
MADVSLDDQVRQALDRALAGVRSHLEADLRAFAQHLLQAAADERIRAVAQATEAAAAEVRQKAHAQLADIRDAAQRHTDDLRRSLDEQITNLRRALADADARAQADVDDARRIAQTQVDDVQRAMDERVAELHQRLSEAEYDRANRLVHAVRLLDEARSLGEVLDELAQGAAREVDRVAVLLHKGDQLVGWTVIGFGEAAPRARAVTVELANAGFLASVFRTGSAEPGSSADTSEGAGLPAFASEPGGGMRSARALPVIVGGAVVAVLYADHPAGAARDTDRWALTLDVLARHASKVLEGLTVQQALGLSLPPPMARASLDAAGLSHDRSVQ